jgi:hypothetical protein
MLFSQSPMNHGSNSGKGNQRHALPRVRQRATKNEKCPYAAKDDGVDSKRSISARRPLAAEHEDAAHGENEKGILGKANEGEKAVECPNKNVHR